MEFNAAQTEMEHLLRVSWIVLIPAGVLLSMVLYKLAMLLHGLVEFLTLARYELAPALKDVRLTAEHVEALSARTLNGVKSVENSVAATGPALRTVGREIRYSAQSLWRGVVKSFSRKR
ncbi:hypothetical protein [Vampirovibrio sp.]|uniref:hypothetical protein n=1 Tax=Vampirovibrio sp. TaxID=2717857 RepID=UPI0035941E5A